MAIASGRALARMHDDKVKRVREDYILREYAKGRTQREIGDELGIDQSTVSGLLRRGLSRYAKDQKRMGDRARALLMIRLEGMFSSWYGLATGDMPDEKAAKIVLGVLDRMAQIQGVGVLNAKIDINVTTSNADAMRAQIAGDLDALATRQRQVIEGVYELEP